MRNSHDMVNEYIRSFTAFLLRRSLLIKRKSWATELTCSSIVYTHSFQQVAAWRHCMHLKDTHTYIQRTHMRTTH